MTSMRVVQMDQYGGPEVLRETHLPRPSMQAGEVLVRVRAAAINPIDAAVRAGYLRERLPVPLPFIPGCDIAGEVVAIAPGVAEFAPGAPVYGMLGIGGGGYAEYVATNAANLAVMPGSIDYVAAAAVPLAALTAWQALFDAGQLAAGQRVLIHAAAGGVGHLAVQLAKWRGAYVIGTASAQNSAFVHTLGADDVIDYHTTRFEQVVRDLDLVVVGASGDSEERSYQVLRPGGRLVSLVGAPQAPHAEAHGVRRTRLFAQPNGAQLLQIAELIDAGVLQVVVAGVWPLQEVATAHLQIETGHTRGKLVLRVRA